MRNQLLVAMFAVLLFCSSSLFAQAAAPQAADLAAIRAQIDAMRADYEKKIQDLQKQLDDIQARQNRAAGSRRSRGHCPGPIHIRHGGSVSNWKGVQSGYLRDRRFSWRRGFE